jgi:NADP-dependent 3-hydroxy acid dehydrogenase YdfG
MTSSSTPAIVAVVTGASSGIGAATARALAADGYRVALLARRLDRITTLAGELGNGPIAIEADVTDRGSIVSAADRVRRELGTAGVLINNAGVMLLGPFDSGQRADYRQMIEVNLLGAITATEVFLEQLKDGGGDIINISSVAGRTARSGNGVYAATKWGINGWSESLRQELLPNVRVTLVEPGVVATELPSHITHAGSRQGVQQLYDKAEVTAEDVAEVIAFILSRPRHVPPWGAAEVSAPFQFSFRAQRIRRGRRVRLPPEHEVGHEVLDGFDHVLAGSGAAVGGLGGGDERGGAVAGDHVAYEHRRDQQGHIDGEGVAVRHAQRGGVEYEVATRGIGWSRAGAPLTELRGHVQHGARPGRVGVVDDQMAGSGLEERDGDGAARAARSDQERSCSGDPGAVVLLRLDEREPVEHVAVPGAIGVAPDDADGTQERGPAGGGRAVRESGVLVRHGDEDPVDVRDGGQGRHHDVEVAVGHLHRDADAVAAAVGEGVREPGRGLDVPDRVADDREEAARAAELAGHDRSRVAGRALFAVHDGDPRGSRASVAAPGVPAPSHAPVVGGLPGLTAGEQPGAGVAGRGRGRPGTLRR